MTEELHREITKRSRLHNNLLKNKLQEDRLKYNKQYEFDKKLLRTTINLYCSNLDLKQKVYHKSFWKKQLSHTFQQDAPTSKSINTKIKIIPILKKETQH